MKLISRHTQSNEMTKKVKNNRATNAFYPSFYQNILGYIEIKFVKNVLEITPDGSYKKCLGNPCIRTQSA